VRQRATGQQTKRGAATGRARAVQFQSDALGRRSATKVSGKRTWVQRVPVATGSSQRDQNHVRPTPFLLVRRTLQDNVYGYLREAIMSGQFAPGDRLTGRGIAALIGTSVMPVREAFRRLTSEGALEPLSTGATRVPVFDMPRLRELHEIRVEVEGLAARRAANRISNDELRELEQLNIDFQRASAEGNLAAEAKANERFHFGIYTAAQSGELLRIIEQLWLRMGPYIRGIMHEADGNGRPQGAKAFRQHKEILLALRRRDAAQAEAAIRADLMLSIELMTGSPRSTAVPATE
jgi:DNA-binding GntR family transcriptional regulator